MGIMESAEYQGKLATLPGSRLGSMGKRSSCLYWFTAKSNYGFMFWQQHWGFHLERPSAWNVVNPAGDQSQEKVPPLHSSFNCSVALLPPPGIKIKHITSKSKCTTLGLNLSLIAWFKKFMYLFYLQKPSKHLQHIIHLPVEIQPKKPCQILMHHNIIFQISSPTVHHHNHGSIPQTQECIVQRRSVTLNRLQ